MNILITGITGFVGSHLADYILENHPECKIFGSVRYRSRLDNIEHIKDKLTLVDVDLKDAYGVETLLLRSNPDRIFHLAAMSYVPSSWSNPAETMDNNLRSQVNILEAVKKLGLESRIQIAGSSEEYGLVYPHETPISEENPLRPLSPYGVAKVAQDFLGYQYHKSHGMYIVRTRAFNHTGPRRGEVFICSDFAKQIVEIEIGKRKPYIKVGNLDAIRDFTDVRDMVHAYWLALEKGKAGEVYNIGSGRVMSMRQMLDLLLLIYQRGAGNPTSDIKVIIDSNRLRPSDVKVLVCDYSKFEATTDWRPEISFEDTLRDLLDYWRVRVQL